ncbi:MAG: tyrosine--tRNA ligase [Candidatus Aminicenantes bacterium]|nr:tyrosine--tRNA ligase [Candidatus Aminicenantes bacterium]MDH5384968.1 tyrosine--tRNA ligase [Candidatus Aminicenantes bacterium]
METNRKSVEEQFEYLKKGCVEIIQENELRTKLDRSLRENKPLRVKAGFDPTAPDIHIGHTVLIRKMKHFQDLDHDVIFLIGDFTGLIGDPSGQSATRPAMTREQILKNAETYKSQIFKILDPKKTIINFNSHWLSKLTSFDIIKLTSKYTVARILERDDFSNRLKSGQPISLHEILYPIMQAYDSVALEADVELGGTDQKFNLLVGRDIQREFQQEPQIVMTMPLLEGLDGVEKMSKSLDNYVGITEPPNEIYGKIMSISDPLMFRYYELLTDIPVSQIEDWRKEIRDERTHPKDLKSNLAKMIVSDFWSEEEAESVAQEFERVFKRKEIPKDIEQIDIPAQKASLIELLVERNILPSRGEAKRLVRQGGVYLDGRRVEDIESKLDFSKKNEYILKIGKRRFFKLVGK